jgi:hypothetical protein
MRDLSLSRRLRPASAASLSLLHYLMQHAEPVPFSEQSPSYDFERLTLPGQPRHTHSSTSHSAAGIALPPLTVDLSADTGIGEIVGVRIYEPLTEPVPPPKSPAAAPQKAGPVRLRPVAERDPALPAHYARQRRRRTSEDVRVVPRVARWEARRRSLLPGRMQGRGQLGTPLRSARRRTRGPCAEAPVVRGGPGPRACSPAWCRGHDPAANGG